MEPMPIIGRTRVMGRPLGTLEEDCGSLEIVDIQCPIWGNRMVSAWEPSDDERRAIADGAPVMLSIVGEGHPVVSIFTGELAPMDGAEP